MRCACQQFFEFSGRSGDKNRTKYHFHDPAQRIIYMAGLWQPGRDKEGLPTDVFAVLTTDANDSVKNIHHRIPVLLAASEIEAWNTDPACIDEVFDRPGPALIGRDVSGTPVQLSLY